MSIELVTSPTDKHPQHDEAKYRETCLFLCAHASFS